MDSIDNLTQINIECIFHLADKFCIGSMPTNLCKDKILCNAFFEPSTRTSMSFESAMLRLGGSVINFNKDSSSLVKGESFEDTIKTIQEFSDVMVLRHPNKDKIFNATKFSSIPIINGGNGDGEHPTQALIDLYTMKKNIDISKPFNICFVGDIKHSRTIHSLIKLMAKMELSCNITFCYYPGCNPEQEYKDEVKALLKLDNIDELPEISENTERYDIFYCTRFQEERHNDNQYDISTQQINDSILNKMKKNAIILHPLPRNNEISIEVDKDPRVKYFEQVKNGVYVRMAILYAILFKELDNTFYTEEYSYRNQLLSEIHYW